MSIGAAIKKRRKDLNMTQHDLANNLCTQAMISKIESDLLNPSSRTLQKIAYKLDVPVSYFYGEKQLDFLDSKTEKLENVIRNHLYKDDYKAIESLLDINKDFINGIRNKENKLFYEWIKGILIYHIDNDVTKAIRTIQNIEKKVDSKSLLFFDITITIANLYYEKKNYEKANHYYESALKKINQKIPFRKKVKLLYNYSLNLDELHYYKDALEVTLQGIDILIQNQSLYMLGYFHYLKGYLLNKISKIDNKDEIVEAYNKAILIFDLTSDKKMLLMTKVQLNEVK